MIKLNRIYIDNFGYKTAHYSDITMAFNDGEFPAHTLLTQDNGGGKTSMISFFMSMFEPSKDKWIQYLQNDKKRHHFQDYFNSDLAVIIMEFVVVDGKKQHKLVLAQTVLEISNSSSIKEYDREFFLIPNQDDAFDTFPSIARNKKDDVPKLIKSWFADLKTQNPDVVSEKTQSTWKRILSSNGFSPMLMSIMHSFNTSEGGVSDFIKFSNEAEFLQLLLGLTSNPEESEEACKVLDKVLKQVQDAPILKKRLDFCNEASYKFTPVITSVEDLNNEKAILKEKSDECVNFKASILLSHKTGNENLNTCINKIKEIKNAYNSLSDEISKNKKLKYAIEKMISDLAEAQSCQEIEKIFKDLNLSSKQEIISSLTSFIVDIDKLEKIIESNEKILLLNNKDLEPLILQKDIETAKLFHCYSILLQEKSERLTTLSNDIKKLTENKNKNQNEIKKLSIEQGKLDSKISEYEKLIDSCNKTISEYSKNGLLEKDETFLNGYSRLREEVRVAEKNKEVLNKNLNDKNKNKSDLETNIHKSNISITGYKQNLASKIKELEKIELEKNSILDNEHSKYYALSDNFYSESILNAIDKDIRSIAQKYSDLQLISLKLKDQVNLLESKDSTLTMDDVQKLCKFLNDNDVNAVSYNEYLSDLYDNDVVKIKELIDSNPSKYLGIKVSGNNDLTKSKELLGKYNVEFPIWISSVEDELTPDSVNDNTIVFGLSDINLYSKKSYEEVLNKTKESYKQSIEKSKKLKAEELEPIEAYYKNLIDFIKNNTEESIIVLESDISSLNVKIRTTEKEIENLNVKIDELSLAIDEITKNILESAQNYEKINSTFNEFSIFERADYSKFDNATKDIAITNQQKTHKEKAIEKEEAEQKENEVSISKKGSDLKELETDIDSLKIKQSNLIVKSNIEIDKSETMPTVSSLEALIESIDENIIKFKEDKSLDDLINRIERDKNKRSKLVSDYENTKSAKLKEYSDEFNSTIEDDYISHYANIFEEKSKNLVKDTEELRQNNLKKRVQHSTAINGLEITKKDNKKQLTKIIESDKPKELSHQEYIDDCMILEEVISLKNLDRDSLECKSVEIVTEIKTLEEKKKKARESNDKLDETKTKIAKWISDIENAEEMLESFEVTGKEDVEAFVNADKLNLNLICSKLKNDYSDAQGNVNFKISFLSRKLMEFKNWIGVDEHRALYPIFVSKIMEYNEENLPIQYIDLKRSIEQIVVARKEELAQLENKKEDAIQILIDVADNSFGCLKKMNSASRIPDHVPLYGGNKIVKIPERVLRSDSELIRAGAERYLNKLLEIRHKSGNENYLPKLPTDTNPKDELRSGLIREILSDTSKDGNLGIKLIKLDTEVEHRTINNLAGSGGQQLTAALLLWFVVIDVYKKELKNMKEEGALVKYPAFLLLDNPTGKSSATSLVNTQVESATNIADIQLIYATGITQINNNHKFKHSILLSKNNKIGKNTKFNLIETKEKTYDDVDYCEKEDLHNISISSFSLTDDALSQLEA